MDGAEMTFQVLRPEDVTLLTTAVQHLNIQQSVVSVADIFCNLRSALECYTIALYNCGLDSGGLALHNQCRNLTLLVLSDCCLVQLDFDLLLGNCPILQVFDLSFNSLSALSYHGLNRSLESLNLHCNRFKVTPRVSGFQRLRTLNLSCNFIETFCPLTNTSIANLDVSANPILLSWSTFNTLTEHRTFARLNISDTYLYDTPLPTESATRFTYFDGLNLLMCDRNTGCNYFKLWKANVHHLVMSQQRPRLHRDYFAKMHIDVYSAPFKAQLEYVLHKPLKQLICICYDTNMYDAIRLVTLVHCLRNNKLTFLNEFRNIALSSSNDIDMPREDDILAAQQLLQTHHSCKLL
jgi:hypothetical protein